VQASPRRLRGVPLHDGGEAPMTVPKYPWTDLQDPEIAALLAKRPVRRIIGRRPALLGIDLYDLVYDGGPRPVIELMEEYPASCGEFAWKALPGTIELYRTARESGVPIVHVTYDTRPETDPRHIHPTNRRRRQPDLNLYRIKAELAPRDGELVVYKKRASAFFGTPLPAFLNELRVDSLIMVGESTSGCLRSSVVEAWSFGYPIAVVGECSFDRYQLSHDVSLLDMHIKYATVVDLAEALRMIRAQTQMNEAS
jgi:nicotinamidase-related amidase